MAEQTFNPGDRVMIETDNNGPIWRGAVEEQQDNGCTWVRWDGDTGSKLVTTSLLERER